MKKGFTLVELLAVIIVLGVISIISVPVVSNQIRNSKINSYRSSVQLSIDAAKEYVVKKYPNNDFPSDGIDITKINLKNKKIKSGIIKRNDNKEIEAYNIYDGTYCASGSKGNIIVKEVDSVDECKTIDFTPPTLELKAVRVTNNSIMINAYASDSQTSIYRYQFKIGDNEYKNVYTSQNVASYTFDNLKSNQDYTISVKVSNENASSQDSQYSSNPTTHTTEEKIFVRTNAVEAPTFVVSSNGYSKVKEVEIKYPTLENGKNYYKFDTDAEVSVNDHSTKISISRNGKLKAYTKYGINTVESTLNIIGIDDKGPEIVSIDNPNDWSTSKVLTVTIKDTGAGLPSKPCSFDGGTTWVSSKSQNNKIVCSQAFTKNQEVDFIVRDKMGNKTSGKDFMGGSSIVISNIDRTNPTLTLGTPTVTSKSISIPITTSDSESGVNKVTCKYSTTSGTYSINATSATTTNCMINNIAHNTTYYYQVCSKDKAGNELCKTGNSKTTVLSVTLKSTSSPTTSSNGYVRSQTWSLTTSGNPNKYYIKSTRAATSSVSLTQSCGTGTTPGTCSSITSTTTMTENTWYYTTSNPSVTYNSSSNSYATLYARISDGYNTTSNTSATVSKIDRTSPSTPTITNPTNGNWTNQSFSVTLRSSDTGSGIAYYQYSYDNSSFTTYSSSASTTYTTTRFTSDSNRYVYFKACDYAGNCSSSAYTLIRIDKTGPTKPKITLVQSSSPSTMDWAYSYSSGSSTKNNVITRAFASDPKSGIGYYQYSHDGYNWSADISTLGWTYTYYNNKTTIDYWITWEGQWNFYVRAVDSLGNPGPASDMFTIRINRTPPAPHLINITSVVTCTGANGSGGIQRLEDPSGAWTGGSATSSTYKVTGDAGCKTEEGSSFNMSASARWTGILYVSRLPAGTSQVVVNYYGRGAVTYTNVSSDIYLSDSKDSNMHCNEYGRTYCVSATAGIESIYAYY